MSDQEPAFRGRIYDSIIDTIGATPLVRVKRLADSHGVKADIVAKGLALGVDFSLTRSCYDPTPDGFACGECDSCRLRLKGFAAAGVTDPAPYRKTP
ncbi:MAG: 7-cyano-7-deazaguanine synthase [Alphaproteobacteria bacterium]|nr:7-cyano-7-deazaguanine synthase [Alphaproteobacteria bacterium]